MADLWVVNSSPLITLAKVEQLPLLMGHGRQLLIPEQVAAEVMAGLEDDPARLALAGGFGAPFYPVPIDPEVSRSHAPAWECRAGAPRPVCSPGNASVRTGSTADAWEPQA